MKIVAVTACPTGIAHTYMAADALIKEAKNRGINIRVETQGAMGIEDRLTVHEIVAADCALIVSDIEIEQYARFTDSKVIQVDVEEVLVDAKSVIDECLKLI